MPILLDIHIVVSIKSNWSRRVLRLLDGTDDILRNGEAGDEGEATGKGDEKDSESFHGY
jgi:hypothetical protein